MASSSASAEQPGKHLTSTGGPKQIRPAEYITPPGRRASESPKRCGPQPAPSSDSYSQIYRLAFYNIGWNYTSKKHTSEALATEIFDMVHERRLDAVGICEVFDLKVTDEDVQKQRETIMQDILMTLNSSAEQPASYGNSSAEQHAWEGKADGHYIFVWNSQRLKEETYEYASCGIDEQPWRMFQYLRFTNREPYNAPPLHVIHCHSPSSKNSPLGNNIGKRSRIFRTLWKYVMSAQASSGYADFTLPVAVFGGDFNCSKSQWTVCLSNETETETSRKSVQECTSSANPNQEGDRALVFNAWAAQEDSRWGKNYPRADKRYRPFTDNHDVVIVPIMWPHRPQCGTGKRSATPTTSPNTSLEPTQTSPDPEVESQLATHSEAASRAEECVSTSGDPQYIHTLECFSNSASISNTSWTNPHLPDRGLTSISAEQPASTTCADKKDDAEDASLRQTLSTSISLSNAGSDNFASSHTPGMLHPGDAGVNMLNAAPSLALPSLDTPLYSALLRKLCHTEDHNILNVMERLFMFDKVKKIKSHSNAAQLADMEGNCYERGRRIEHLLTLTSHQRRKHLVRLSDRRDRRSRNPEGLVFTDKDMQEIMNRWRNRTDKWSNQYYDPTLTAEERHRRIHANFNAFLFQIFGCKALVEMCIKFPICSADQPALFLKKFTNDWLEWRGSPEREDLKKRCEKKGDNRTRPSQEIWLLTQRYGVAKQAYEKLQRNWNIWWDVGQDQRTLYYEFESGAITKQIQELQIQQQEKFPGAAARITGSWDIVWRTHGA